MSSPFFKDTEFACKCDYENCVESERNMKQKFLDAIYWVRSQVDFPMIVTSGYRCKKHNKDVGGARYSFHARGMAADFHMVDAKQRYELVEAAIAAGLSVIVYSNFVHLDAREGEPVLLWGKY